MKNKLKIFVLGLVIVTGSLLFGFCSKTTPHKPLYENTYHTGYTIDRSKGGAKLGTCYNILAEFKAYEDSASLAFVGKPVIRYKVLGVDSAQGLHLLRDDGFLVIAYRVRDARYPITDKKAECLHMISLASEMVFFPSEICQ